MFGMLKIMQSVKRYQFPHLRQGLRVVLESVQVVLESAMRMDLSE